MFSWPRKSSSLICLLSLSLVLAAGCATTSSGHASADPEISQGAAERLWRRKCVECHGLHAPSRLSDGGWARTMDEMAVEARLNDQEKAAILDYLQENNGRP